MPDLSKDDLGQMLKSIFEDDIGSITRQKIADAIALTSFFICALQQTYSKIVTGEPALPSCFWPHADLFPPTSQLNGILSTCPPRSLASGRGSTRPMLRCNDCIAA